MNVLLIPLGSAGDVHPFVGIGLALRQRGHAVTVFTNPYFEQLVRRVGLDFLGLGTEEEFRTTLAYADIWHPRKAFPFIVRRGILPALRPVYETIAERSTRGSLVVVAGTLALGARIAQEKLRVPLVSVHLQPAVLRTAYQAPRLPPLFLPHWLPRWMKRFQYWLADVAFIDPLLAPEVNRFRAELGLPPVSRLLDGWWNSPQRVLGLWPEWFTAKQPDWPAQLRLTGFPLYDERGAAEAPPDLEEFLATDTLGNGTGAFGSPVVFTAGSANRHCRPFFETSVEACRLLGRRGVLLTRFADQVPHPLPPGVRHYEFVPLSQLLPRAAAMVHHGGIGTAAQALAAGVPQLVVPLSHDQPDNADRLRRLGVADVLPLSRYQPHAATRTLDRLLNAEKVASRCREIAARFRGGDPLGDACRVIEELAL